MKIYYRGYLIIGDSFQTPGCTVQGTRPERETLAVEDSPRAAMHWIDRDVLRRKVRAAGWLSHQPLSAQPANLGG